jgi:hypothetical protein
MTIIPRQKNAPDSGSTLVEALVAMAIVAVFVVAGMSAMYFNRIQAYKDKERGLLLDFAVHYLELVKGQPFSELKKGNAINALYDGTAGSPNIRIPASFTWSSLLDNNYIAFSPELTWLSARNPEIRVNLTTTQVGGVDHTKLVQVELRWDAPLQQGGKLTARMDMARFKDL